MKLGDKDAVEARETLRLLGLKPMEGSSNMRGEFWITRRQGIRTSFHTIRNRERHSWNKHSTRSSTRSSNRNSPYGFERRPGCSVPAPEQGADEDRRQRAWTLDGLKVWPDASPLATLASEAWSRPRQGGSE